MAHRQCNGRKVYQSRRRMWDQRPLGHHLASSTRTGDGDASCTRGARLHADSVYALSARQTPASAGCGACATKQCGRADGGSARRIGMGRGHKRVTRLYRAQMMMYWRGTAGGEHTDRCADRQNLTLQCAPALAWTRGQGAAGSETRPDASATDAQLPEYTGQAEVRAKVGDKRNRVESELSMPCWPRLSDAITLISQAGVWSSCDRCAARRRWRCRGSRGLKNSTQPAGSHCSKRNHCSASLWLMS
jgi:hypothetical protein